MITQLFEKKDDHMKIVTFVLDWKAITVYGNKGGYIHIYIIYLNKVMIRAAFADVDLLTTC